MKNKLVIAATLAMVMSVAGCMAEVEEPVVGSSQAASEVDAGQMGCPPDTSTHKVAWYWFDDECIAAVSAWFTDEEAACKSYCEQVPGCPHKSTSTATCTWYTFQEDDFVADNTCTCTSGLM
jgi:hypothetical protein